MTIEPLEKQVIGVFPWPDKKGETVETFVKSDVGNFRVCVKNSNSERRIECLRDVDIIIEDIISQTEEAYNKAVEYSRVNYSSYYTNENPNEDDPLMEGIWVSDSGTATYQFFFFMHDNTFAYERDTKGKLKVVEQNEV